MTKLRETGSFEEAWGIVCNALGWAEVGKLIPRHDANGNAEPRSERTLRDYGDPDHPSRIAIEDAYTLDNAYNVAGGDGWPILESYIFRLKAEAAAFGHDAEALSRLTASAAIEVGQSIASLIVASRPGASPADRALAKRETRQALGALSHTLPMLNGAGPSSDRVTPLGGATS